MNKDHVVVSLAGYVNTKHKLFGIPADTWLVDGNGMLSIKRDGHTVMSIRSGVWDYIHFGRAADIYIAPDDKTKQQLKNYVTDTYISNRAKMWLFLNDLVHGNLHLPDGPAEERLSALIAKAEALLEEINASNEEAPSAMDK